MDKRYSIGEIAEMTGVPRRTVRFYVQQGLLAPPCGAGRGHYYTDAHVKRLGEIRKLQEAGLALRDIAARLIEGKGDAAVREDAAPFSAAEPWMRFLVAPGCEIHLQTGICRMTASRYGRLQDAIRNIFPELDHLPREK